MQVWGWWPLLLAAWLLSSNVLGQPLNSPVKDKTALGPVAGREVGPGWAQLNKNQQLHLAPLKDEWVRVDAPQKQKWLEVANRMPRMNAEERARIQKRMTEWVRMSPTERGQARFQFQEARQLAPAGRQEQWDAYQALSPEQRRALSALATQAAKKPPTTKPARPVTVAGAQGNATGAGKTANPNTKRNIVSMTPTSAGRRQVAPMVVQSRQGATTSLVTTAPRPPAHQQVGLPKVNAGADFVDPLTLLPRRGPQGVAAAQAFKPAEAAPTLTQ